VTVEEGELRSAVADGVRLHGHLGPFLIIGVRMGLVARRRFGPLTNAGCSLRVAVRVPAFTPFSCVIDGIQSSTGCMVGNQKLKVQGSRRRIVATFEVFHVDSRKTFEVQVDERLVERLIRKLSEGVANEELAAQVASMPEDECFRWKRVGVSRIGVLV
jgi:formylmethanofuran dehydrogenase subunit E